MPATNTARKLALLGALYFVQGLPFGFQAVALPIYLRENEVSLTAIGFVGALSLPWMLKALWAPLVDRYASDRFGRRKSWIVPLQIGLAATCAAAAFVPPSELGLLLALVFLMNLFAATQDIAVDGLAVDLLGPEELGPGNAGQVVGYKIGMLTGGGLLVWASRWLGWRGLFLTMALLVALVVLIVLQYRERPVRGAATGGADRLGVRAIVVRLWRAVTTPGGGWLVAFIVTYKLGESMVDSMFKPFLVDAGFEGPDIGLWVGTWGMGFSIAGSLAGGWLAGRHPLWTALAITAVLRIFPLAAEWALAASGSPSAAGVISVTCAEHFCGGALTTAVFAFMMSRVDREIGASHYTALAAIEVFGKSPAAWAAGPLATHLGYAWLFGLGTLLSVAFLVLLLPLRRLEGVAGG